MGFSRQEYWSGLPFPPPGHLPDPGIESRSPALQADTLLSESPGKPFIEHIPKSLHQAWPKSGVRRGEGKMPDTGDDLGPQEDDILFRQLP